MPFRPNGTIFMCRRGIALPTAIFGMLMLSLLGAAIWSAIEVSGKSANNRWQSVSAMQLAEAGAAHGLALLRNDLSAETYTDLLLGDDGLSSTADDGLLIGYGLTSGQEIPASGNSLGGGTYTVQIVDDPNESDGNPFADSNDRIILRCTGTTPSGGSVTIDATMGEATEGGGDFPAILMDGLLNISGNPDILGDCGAIHSNSDINVSGDTIVAEYISSSGDVDVGGSVEDEAGNPVTPLENQPQIAVPDYSDPTATHCGNADYYLQADGYVRRVSDNTLHDARSSSKFNWKRSGTSPLIWETDGDATTWPGFFCAAGNVKIGNSMGSSTQTPFSLTVVANGSIEVSGNPLLLGDDEDGILFMAKGDLKISGTLIGQQTNYDGFMYGRDQCEVSGNPYLHGQLVCANFITSGVRDLVTENKLNGDMTLIFDCDGYGGLGGGGSDVRRIVSWSQRFN